MLRTKDLVLFVVCILFILIAIMATLFRGGESSETSVPPTAISDSTADRVGEYVASAIDRPSIISRLRQALSDGTTISAPEPIEPIADATDNPVSNVTGQVVQDRCSNQYDALTYARSWPRTGVAVSVLEGARMVIHESVEEIEVAVVVGTSTVMQTQANTITTPLLQLPVAPVPSGQYCLSSEIIGITTGGLLLFNSDAIAYYRTDPNTLVGYARDGLPIYGAYTGEIDACGGYKVAGEYRYSINSDRSFILGCYSAEPQTFVGE